MNSDAAAGPNSAARADGAGCPLTGAPPDGGTDRVASEEAILSRAKAILFAERGVQALGLGAAASRAAAAAGSSCTSGYCPPAETAAHPRGRSHHRIHQTPCAEENRGGNAGPTQSM